MKNKKLPRGQHWIEHLFYSPLALIVCMKHLKPAYHRWL